ncbi:MAG: hypothetical protein ABII08_04870, partial [Candidatus Beckwithbacteria bacterium]
MKAKKALQYLVIFLSFLFVFPKFSFAAADLVLTGFDTCWEVYDGGEWGPSWKAWSWLRIRNQGDTASNPSTAGISYYTNSALVTWAGITTNIAVSSIAAGETRTVQGWSAMDYSDQLCETAGGLWGTIIDYGGYSYSCGGSTAAHVSLGSNESIESFSAYPGSLVPGHPNYSCSGATNTPTPTSPPSATNTPTPTPTSPPAATNTPTSPPSATNTPTPTSTPTPVAALQCSITGPASLTLGQNGSYTTSSTNVN